MGQSAVAHEPQVGVVTDEHVLKVTTAVTELVPAQLPVDVPDTVYVVVEEGVTDIVEVFTPVLHVYVFAPEADNVALLPEHIVGLFTVISGPTAIPAPAVIV